MAIYKLHRDSLISTWWRDYYEIEADTQEEAVRKILDEEEEYYDSEMLDIWGDTEQTIIEDDDNKELYNSNKL